MGVAINSTSQTPSIRAIVVQADGNLILGGQFTSFNRVAATNLVRIRPDGTLDRKVRPAVGGSAVNALAKDASIAAGRADPGWHTDRGFARPCDMASVAHRP
jgi:hypothetical protein